MLSNLRRLVPEVRRLGCRTGDALRGVLDLTQTIAFVLARLSPAVHKRADCGRGRQVGVRDNCRSCVFGSVAGGKRVEAHRRRRKKSADGGCNYGCHCYRYSYLAVYAAVKTNIAIGSQRLDRFRLPLPAPAEQIIPRAALVLLIARLMI